MAVSEANAYRHLDNFAVMSDDFLIFYGCEHNQQEAEAVAKWVTSNTGRLTTVVRNGPDDVRRAKELRPGVNPQRYERREEALIDMGIWERPKPRRRRA